MTELYTQITELGLKEIYYYVMVNNKSSNLPYHNNFHLEHVCLFALKGCKHYSVDNQYRKLIATAALFHDMNHSGSGKNDDDNILLSVEAFLKFNTDNYEFIEEEQKIIINLIKATRYPYTKECGELTLYEKILRDSDVLQGPFCQNYINGVVFGIAKEANIPLNKMIEGQEGFLTSMVFCTDWANTLYKEVLPSTLEKINTIK